MFAWMKRKARSFFSAKAGGRLKGMVPLILGLLLTGIALAAAGRRIAAVENDIRGQTAPVEVVVASVPIASGETFSERNLAKKNLPAAGIGQRNVPASEFGLLLGSRAKIPVAPGEPVLWTDIEEPYETETFSRAIGIGRRAITLRADSISSFAGLLHPGDRVDLLCEREGKHDSTWVRSIPVAAVDRNHNRLGKPSDNAEAATVTLFVTPEEGARISSVAGSGKLHWFLRNPEDNTVTSRPMKQGWSPHGLVEVWKGGIRVFPGPPAKESTE